MSEQNSEAEGVLISQENYDNLISLLSEQRTDLTILATTFQDITSLFSGKTSALSMVPTIMKLINDPKQLEAFQHIIPIIEKYTPKPVNNG